MDRIDTLLDTIQQLQHQRLSIRLLDLAQLNTLHQSIISVAKSHNYQLLTTQPQDYFQLDVSYLRRGPNVMIILHVPTLTDNNLLTVYKYANLPYPTAHFLTAPSANETLKHLAPIHTVQDLLNFNNPANFANAPEAIHFMPEADLIAIGRSTGDSHRYKLLDLADLAGCVKRNHVYLCERHQILRTDLEGSCLGSLYLQSERGVRENCKLERRPLKETVYQLSATDHLVVSPAPFTTQILCHNGSHFPLRLKATTRVTIPPSCYVKLKNHTISADDNIRLAPEPLQFQWTFNPLILPSETLQNAAHLDDELNHLKSTIKILQNNTISDEQFTSILNDNLSQTSPFSALLWVTFSIAIASVAFTCCWFGCARKWYFRHRQPRNIPMPLQPAHNPHILLPPVEQLPNNIEDIAALDLPPYN
jgi:hypothetical protein